MYTIQELAKILIRAEKELNLFNYNILDLPLWWFCRDRVLVYIFRLTNNIDLATSSAEGLTVKEIISKVKEAVHINNFKKHDILAISTSSARRVQVESKDFDVFFDFLSWTKNSNNYAILETPDRSRHSFNPYSKFRYYGDYVVLIGNLCRRLSGYLGNNGLVNEYSHIIYEWLVNNGLKVQFGSLQRVISREYAFASIGILMAENIISKIRPKFLLVECGYSPSHMIFQFAAKRIGIPVIEIQHGLIVPNSLGYFFGTINDDQLKNSPFPDKIFVYGNHFRKVLLENSYLNDSKIKILGNPLLWKLRQDYTKNKEKNSNILIATQPELSDFFIELITKLAEKTKNTIYVKPHPSEVGRVGKQNILESYSNVVTMQPGTSIYSVFGEVDYHISVGSMTHLEALLFGLKDIIVCGGGFENYYDFLVNMGIPSVSDVEQIYDVIVDYPNIDSIYSYIYEEVFNMSSDPTSVIGELMELS